MGVAVPGAEVRQAVGGEKCGGRRAERKCGVRPQRPRSLDVDAEHQLENGIGELGSKFGSLVG